MEDYNLTKKTQRVEINTVILDNTLVEAIRSPRLGKEAQRDRLAKAVELEATATARIHNGGVVNDFNINVALLRSNPKVAVRRRSLNERRKEGQTQRRHQRRGTPYCTLQRCPESSPRWTPRDHGRRQ